MTLPAFWGNSGIKNFSHGLCIRTGHVFVWGTNPLSRLRRHLPPAGGSLSKGESLAKRADEPLPSFRFAKCHLPRRWRPWQRGQVSSSPVTGQKEPAVKLQTFCPCQSLSLSGEVARRSRDGEGCLPEQTLSVSLRSTARSPFCRLPATSSPSRGKSFHSGDALGKEGRFRPHSLTAERIQLLSGKRSAFAKASPFRERWHGEAVTERVPPRLTAAFGKRFFHGPAERPSSLESRY